MKVGDIIAHRKKVSWGRKTVRCGIVVNIKIEKEDSFTFEWAHILWPDGLMTWEDVEAYAVDSFEVINEAR